MFGAEVDVLRGRVPQALAAGVQPLTVGQPQAAPGVVFLGKSAEPQNREHQTAAARDQDAQAPQARGADLPATLSDYHPLGVN